MKVLESELAPDSVLPEQLRDRSFAGARLQPEKRLQVAVLADAVLTFHRWAGNERTRARRLFAEIEAWFASDDADGPFTFVVICQSLAFDPGYLRRGLRQWRAHVLVRREASGTRHHVVLPRLRRVA
jgi:hypothetical protein